MIIKNFSKFTFTISTIVFGILLFPSFLAAWAEDEGTLGTNIIWVTFAKLFYILRFPTHTLLWKLITKGGTSIFFGGLIINCLFYGLLTERIINIFKLQKKSSSEKKSST
jgi:hypothetical protein